MRRAQPRPIPLLTGLSLLAAIGCGWLVWPGQSPLTGKREGKTGTPVTAARTVHFDRSDRQSVQESNVYGAASQPTEEANRGPAMELTGDAAAQFAALCALRLLAADTDLDLSHREWAKLSALIAEWQEVRLAYEAEIAHIEPLAPGRHRIEIPAYAEAGDELRRRFESSLSDALGVAVAAEVRAKLGRQLEATFAGFGVSSQTLLVSGDPQRSPATVTIERTARYWNSIDGPERATTHRDMHFPTLTTAAGEAWKPLLAPLGRSG